jgi:RNA polymerase sigma-70 factor (ECF subfamily)
VSHGVAAELRERIDLLYRSESRRALATLIRLLGDFDLAEEALQDAFTAAMEQWPRDGMPANPRAWLVSTGRFKAIDRLRRRARFDGGNRPRLPHGSADGGPAHRARQGEDPGRAHPL